MFSQDQIHSYLETAVSEAEKALSDNNYPIGSVIVNSEGSVESVDRNQCTTNEDVTAHAEILGIRKLKNKINKYTPGEYYLFSSLEPCFGCSFFIARTNIRHIVSALKDPHKGGTGDLKAMEKLNHFFKEIEIINEPFKELKEKSRELMKKYFLKIGRKETARYYGHKED